MKCSRCQHDNPEGQRFCGDCGERLGLFCPSGGATSEPEQKFCADCGASLAGGPNPFGAPDLYTPPHLAERILTSRAAPEGERKQVSVLFADLKGSMELLAEGDPEEARQLLASWGWVLSWAGRPVEGLPFIERAITLFETVGIKAFLALRYVEWAEGSLLAVRSTTRGARPCAASISRSRTASRPPRPRRAACSARSRSPRSCPTRSRRERTTRRRSRSRSGWGWCCPSRAVISGGRVESLARHADLARGHLESAGRVYRQAGSKYWIARVDEALAEVR